MAELLTPQKPCLYCRLSYAPDGSLEKVERQEADGRTMAGRLNWPDFCCVYVDNSASAWQRNRKRPDWDRMLISIDGAAEHRHDGIMVYHGDRLIRQPYDLELLLNISDQQRIPLASVSGVRDLSSPDDRFILRIEAAQACRESDNTSRRVKRGIKARTSKGRARPGGRRPFGWGVDTGRVRVKVDPESGEERVLPVLDYDQVVPEEAKLLADVAGRVQAGMSKRGAVRWMNARSTTSMGNPWCVTTLTRALLAPRMAALVEHQGVYHKAVWDKVISQELWEDLRALLAERGEKYGYHGHDRRHLLSGIAECSDCTTATTECRACADDIVGRCMKHRATVWTKPVGKKGARRSLIYYCKICGRGRNEAHLDAFVGAKCVQLLNQADFLEELHSPAFDTSPASEIASLEQRRAKTKKTLENLGETELDPEVVVASLASFDRRISRLRERLATTAERRVLLTVAGISREEWEGLDIDVRASVVSALFRVEVKRARMGAGFDAESVRLVRKALSSSS
ncbi:recombinase family protein [Streptomyces sp. NPDC088124]|uniref:recombinase family protein n=1 Tax=Streptomyces sp. NPDC088124 TaxID=3154654 RepID=UPI003434EAAF